jgi:hypothetical protein
LVVGVLAAIPVFFLCAGLVGLYGAIGGVVVLWTSGVVWLLKKRQDDPAGDRSSTTGRH